MAEYSRAATWEDLKTVIRLLNDAQVDYALVGGYAVAAHGIGRLTQDVDVLVNPAPPNSQRWIMALGQLPDRAALTLAADTDVFAQDKRYALRINDEFTVDVMPSVAGHSWQELSAYIQTIDLDGLPLRLLNLEGLLLTKQGLRPQDQADAAVLREAIAFLKSRK